VREIRTLGLMLAGAGNGAMGWIEAPVVGESRWKQLLPVA
jgi:hypothetical protein